MKLRFISILAVAGCGVTAHPHASRQGDSNVARPDAGRDRAGPEVGPSPDVAPPVTAGRDAAPAVDPGPGVTVDGRFVARERAVVFIHIGHSDMAGRADGPASLRPFFTDEHPQLWTYARGGSFRPAREPTAGDSGSAGKAGPGMAILKTALAGAPGTTFISVGHGHSGASGGYCPNFRRGQAIWPTFMDAARELKGRVTFGAVFTMFGITEYHVPNGPAQVGDCIAGLMNEIRAELDAPDMPLMVGDWNMGGTGIYSPTGEYGQAARPALARIPMRDPRAALIPTDGLAMHDDRHLNMAGHKLWAERAFQIMLERGWTPWANVSSAPARP